MRAAILRPASTVALTLAAVVAIFALEPVAGVDPPGTEPGDEAADPGYVQLGRWAGMVVRLEFRPTWAELPPIRNLADILVPTLMTVTFALAAYVGTLLMASAVLAAFNERVRPLRTGVFITVLASAMPLIWLASTLVVVGDQLNEQVGASVLPTVAGDPRYAIADPLTVSMSSWVSVALYLAHHSVFPAIVVTIGYAPAMVWWLRRSWPPLVNMDASLGDLIREVANVGDRAFRLFPLFVAGVIVVELASGSDGAGDLMLRRLESDHVFLAATVLLALGVVVSLVQLYLSVALGVIRASAGRTTEQHLTQRGQATSPTPERVRDRRHRPRSAHLARLGLLMVAGVVLAASYATLWFSTGPNDVVSTDGASPPSATHWLGVDSLGRDQLARMAAAVQGSLFVAGMAAIVAVVAGRAWLSMSSRLPARVSSGAKRSAGPLLALPAAAWIALPGGQRGQTFFFAGERLTLAITIGALAVPLAIYLLEHHGGRTLDTTSWAVRYGPLSRLGISTAWASLAGTWFTILAGALVVEYVATFALFTLGERAPTLGAVSARPVTSLTETPFPGDPHVMTTWPWLWYPPAIVVTLLVAGFMVLAAASFLRTIDGHVHDMASGEEWSEPSIAGRRHG